MNTYGHSEGSTYNPETLQRPSSVERDRTGVGVPGVVTGNLAEGIL